MLKMLFISKYIFVCAYNIYEFVSFKHIQTVGNNICPTYY